MIEICVEPIDMQQQPQQPSPITDDEIIDLARAYDGTSPARRKNTDDYLRDGTYYTNGYVRLRMKGLTHEQARDIFLGTAERDAYYDVDINVPGLPWLGDNEIIDVSARFISRYRAIGRFQRQNRQENFRDLTFYFRNYLEYRRRGFDHERAMRQMERDMNAEAGLPDPYPVLVEPMTALTPAGRIFLRDGQPHRVKGASAFQLLDQFANTGDVSAYARTYRDKGYNMFRVWPYVPVPPWDPGWNPPPNDVTVAFVGHLRDEGFTVEITLLTDDDQSRIPWARRLVEDLAGARPANLLIEIGNEPLTNKNIRVEDLKDVCDRSGFLYSSGIYEDSERTFGRYGTHHSPRDREWPRKSHDALEFYNGGGPNEPSDPPHRMPWLLDEPIRPDEAGGNIEDKRRDFYAYAAGASIMAAGATFHSNSGKFAGFPGGEDDLCADAFARGLNVFPPDAPNGPYERIVENTLRTYVVGPYMVRIRPQSPQPPRSGFRALDEFAICFVRG